jgi:hypothetical protein
MSSSQQAACRNHVGPAIAYLQRNGAFPVTARSILRVFVGVPTMMSSTGHEARTASAMFRQTPLPVQPSSPETSSSRSQLKRTGFVPKVVSRTELEQLLADDVPYGDLTTDALGVGAAPGSMEFTARDKMVLALAEDAAVSYRGHVSLGRVRPKAPRETCQ